MTPVEISAVATAFATFVGALTVVRRWKPQTDSIYITNAQGSFNIVNSLVETLQKELARKDAKLLQLEATVAWYAAQYGPPTRRETDPDAPSMPKA